MKETGLFSETLNLINPPEKRFVPLLMAAEIFNYVKIIDYLMCFRKEQEGLLLSNRNLTHEGYEGLKTRQKRVVLGLALLFAFFFFYFLIQWIKTFF